jgi:ABC-type multidrug transport system fused ATPase/permease subunit
MLNEVLHSFKKEIWFNYFLILIEFLCEAIIPWLLGKTIDNLMNREHDMFMVYIICIIIGLFVGIFRRALDTRIFSKIGKDLCIKTIKEMFSKDIDSNKISARINNLYKFTGFYEHFVPQFVKSSVQIITAFCVLCSSIHYFSIIVCLIMCLTLLSSYYYANKTEILIKKLQLEEEERQYYLFEERNIDKLEEKHTNIRNLSIKKSDYDAINWGFFDVCYYSSCVLSLYMLIKYNHTVGEVTSSLMYVGSFCTHFSMFAYAFTYFKELKVAKEFIRDVE